MPAIGNASLLEILWSMLAAFGLVFAALNARARQADLIWLRKSGRDSGRRIVARSHLREEVFAICKLSLLLVVGLAAMAVPAPPNNPRLWLSALTGACIISVELFIVAGSVFRFYERRALIASIEGDAEHGF